MRVEIPVAVAAVDVFAAVEPSASAAVAAAAESVAAVVADSVAAVVEAASAVDSVADGLVIREEPVVGVNLLVDEPEPEPVELAEKMVRFATPVLPPSPEPHESHESHDLVTYDL